MSPSDVIEWTGTGKWPWGVENPSLRASLGITAIGHSDCHHIAW